MQFYLYHEIHQQKWTDTFRSQVKVLLWNGIPCGDEFRKLQSALQIAVHFGRYSSIDVGFDDLSGSPKLLFCNFVILYCNEARRAFLFERKFVFLSDVCFCCQFESFWNEYDFWVQDFLGVHHLSVYFVHLFLDSCALCSEIELFYVYSSVYWASLLECQ